MRKRLSVDLPNKSTMRTRPSLGDSTNGIVERFLRHSCHKGDNHSGISLCMVIDPSYEMRFTHILLIQSSMAHLKKPELELLKKAM